jgi:hypothetical protein
VSKLNKEKVLVCILVNIYVVKFILKQMERLVTSLIITTPYVVKIVVLYFSTNGFINTAEFKITLGVNSLSLFLF